MPESQIQIVNVVIRFEVPIGNTEAFPVLIAAVDALDWGKVSAALNRLDVLQ